MGIGLVLKGCCLYHISINLITLCIDYGSKESEVIAYVLVLEVYKLSSGTCFTVISSLLLQYTFGM